MDVFIEKIVSKKKDMKDHLISLLGAFIGLIIIFLGLNFAGTFIIFIFAAVVYGEYLLVRSRNLEFEYIITNGDFDIDKIIARSRRKRIFSADSKIFEVVASIKSVHFTKDIKENSTYISTISSKESENIYFIYLTYKGKKTVVLFEPDERILKSMKNVNRRNVHISN